MSTINKYESRGKLDSKIFSELEKIRNECGHEATFRMVLSHLFHEGFRKCQDISDVTLDEYLAQEKEREKKETEEYEKKIANGEKARRTISVISPEFQVQLWKMARAFAQFQIWDILKYIQNYVYIGG